MNKVFVVGTGLTVLLAVALGMRSFGESDPASLVLETRAEQLEVKYNGSTLIITGGDGGGEDLTVNYGTVTSIAWTRVGTNFRFIGISFDPTTGPFSCENVTDSEISLVDTNQNSSGSPIEYKYSITYEDLGTNEVRVYDPKVINKGSPN